MAWVYEIVSGFLYDDTDHIRARGYSGHGEFKNDPSKCVVKHGPIPLGKWAIGPPFNTDKHGPFCIPLGPIEVELNGRSGFLIHGDSLEHPGEASEGCIILPHATRVLIWDSKDHRLLVVAQLVARVGMGDVKMADYREAYGA